MMGWKNDELKDDRSSCLPEMDSYRVMAQTPHIGDDHPTRNPYAGHINPYISLLLG